MDSDRQSRHSQDASRHIKPLDVYKQTLAGLHQESQEQIKLPEHRVFFGNEVWG